MRPISNNKELCVVGKSNTNINSILNEIFNGYRHSYNIRVIIYTKDKLLDTYLIGRNNGSVITLDNEIIKIDEIVSIEIKNQESR